MTSQSVKPQPNRTRERACPSVGDALQTAEEVAVVRTRFEAPRAAAHLRSPGAWVAFSLVVAVGAVAAFTAHPEPVLACAHPIVATIVLALLATVLNSFGSHANVAGISKYTSLQGSLLFAMLLGVDWHLFVAGTAGAQIASFLSERARRRDATMWYLRIFNVSLCVLCGAAASFALHAPAWFGRATSTWRSPEALPLSALAGLVWVLVDGAASALVVVLSARAPLSSAPLEIGEILSESCLLTVGVPIALTWQSAPWLSAFAVAPLILSHVVLRVPELEHRALNDDRTGIANASAFDAHLETAIEEAARTQRPLSLLLLDIDRFKNVNDLYGHAAGDTVLRSFAEALTAARRKGDFVARLGGDEFAMILRDSDASAAHAVAERFRATLATRAPLPPRGSEPTSVTASVGVATYPTGAPSSRRLFEAADAALYAAKRQGRDRVHLHA